MLTDDEIYEMEREDETRKCTLEEFPLTPVLSNEEYKAQILCFQTPAPPMQAIKPNVVYRDGKQIKFLLLPKAITPSVYLKALDVKFQ